MMTQPNGVNKLDAKWTEDPIQKCEKVE
jgi:hypothetical protein